MPVHKKKNTTPNGNGATSNIASPQQLGPENFHQYLRAEIRDATRTVMEEIMREELSQFLERHGEKALRNAKAIAMGSTHVI